MIMKRLSLLSNKRVKPEEKKCQIPFLSFGRSGVIVFFNKRYSLKESPRTGNRSSILLQAQILWHHPKALPRKRDPDVGHGFF
jgi:hypothetical protein